MEETDDLDIKAEIDQISQKIDDIINKIEHIQDDQVKNLDQEDQ
jgi:hypothetical protein